MNNMSSKKMENSQKPMLLFLGICIFSLQWMLTHQEVNVALGGIATQSSVYSYYPAYFAIDGNRESNAYLHSCTHTNYDYKPWWRVDLLAVYDISNVIVTNRGDAVPERINGAEIRIGNSLVNNGNNNPRCVVISSIPAGASVNYTCKMTGRYVNIIIPNVSQFLTLCEVEVYAVPVPVTKRAFLRLKFNSIEDLMNPTVRDKVLQKVISVNVRPSVYQIRWTKQPERKTEL
ncbi:fucolectin-like [Ictalurus punctatus]|uniref:Fucolectin-like n=1 Tax=Ictalurus punctatus TaxID=7998 RepID=A0A9F7TID6_ICTPU|nr:fucolectin-like [Ictalurus punctatus]